MLIIIIIIIIIFNVILHTFYDSTGCKLTFSSIWYIKRIQNDIKITYCMMQNDLKCHLNLSNINTSGR